MIMSRAIIVSDMIILLTMKIRSISTVRS